MILPILALVFSLIVNHPTVVPSCTLARAEVGSKWCEVITEDSPLWNCATMGNKICGDVPNPVYWPIRY